MCECQRSTCVQTVYDARVVQVDDTNKVQRLRKDCPHDMCGRGVRMAVHANRLHCGKCTLTFKLGGAEEEKV
jgi:ribosomal protein S27AE